MNKIKKDNNDIFSEICKEKGLKLTPQRLEIYNCMAQDFSHPNAEKVHQQLKKKNPSLSFDTVNRTLHLFVEKGIIRAVADHGNTKRYDPIAQPHHHFRCLKCGEIIDFENSYYDKIKIPVDLNKMFKIVNKIVVLEGICEKCKKLK